MQQNNHWFLHVDLDAFFASVEQLDHPEYRGKPVIVGGKPEDKRSVVSTASYEARKYGVHSAMPTALAYRLCPHGIYVHGRMERYAELSYKIMNIFKEYSPDVEQMSIDEAFIDITGTENLFGPPEETALKIKKQVYDYTGLTVSVGLATNKYLAKIASGMSKPDGFYFIKPGTEESFMLSLPLNKVWGVGKKTLETIKKSGINSTLELHEQSLEVLQFMYGNNMGNFLYNAVRGIDTVGFGRTPKSHSISTETTFIEDITDIYTLETKLLELCHGLIFRLLKENSFSRTAMVKIRYSDFSTVSIQKTVDYNIVTLDSLFEIVKQIFNEKYDHKTGIRLIGVGLENIESKPQPEQLYLFDDNKKKRNVEKAILKIEQTHPDIKIHKARLLMKNIEKTTKTILLCLLLFNFSFLFHGQQNTNQTDSLGAAGLFPDSIDTSSENNADSDFPEWNLANSNLKYDISGYWAAEITGGLNTTFGNNTSFGISTTTPVFKQEINLSALINITDNWLFDLDFADNFSKNTYTLSYENNDYLNSFYLSNRNITFPFYSGELNNFSISGGENQAPGASLHLVDFEKNKWSADFLVRYDFLSQKDATFYGKNVVTDLNIPLSNYIQSKLFIIPDSSFLTDIKNIYIEDAKGSFIDKNGRKFKKLNDSEYKTIASKNLLILQNDISNQNYNGKIPEILITVNNSSIPNFLHNLGSYSDESSFLGKIQTFFNEDNLYKINLEDYTYKFTTEIDNTNALIIQSPQGFSPFLYCSLYDCGIIQDAEASIVSSSTEIVNKEYYSEVSEDLFDFVKNNFFFENHKYIQIGLYSEKTTSFTEPCQRYPFARTNPFIYLNSINNSDFILRIRRYNSISNFDIGKKASTGSIKVYINGILDSNAKYESSSGFVTLSKNVSETDKIYITWNEETDNIQNSALSLGAGYKYNFSQNVTGDISLTSSIPFSPFTKFADSDNLLNSFTAVSAGINYSNDNLTITDGLSLSLINENLTGTLLANYQKEAASQTYYLSYSNGYKTNVVPQLNINNSPLLQSQNNCTVMNYSGIGDKNITGYKIPLEWDFSNNNLESPNWASVDIKLSAGDFLCNSSELEIALQPASSYSDIDVYLQLGIKAEKDFSGETKNLIPTWKITGTEDSKVLNNFDSTDINWQIVKIKLTDSDRAKLVSNHDLRLIVVSKNSGTESENGIIFTGPYEPRIKGNQVINSDKLFTNSSLVLINDSPSGKELFETDNQGTMINWTTLSSIGSPEDFIFSTENYFNYCDFSNYNNIILDLFISAKNEKEISLFSETGFELILDSPLVSDSPAVKLNVSSEYLKDLLTQGIWHTINIDKNSRQVFIDNIKVPDEFYYLEINQKIKPSRQKISFSTCSGSSLFENGLIIVGNLYLKNINPYFDARNTLKIQYENEELFFIKNLNINLSSQQSAVFSLSDKENNNASINGTIDGEFSIYNFDFQTNYIFDSDNLSKDTWLLSQTNQKIKTNTPLFNVFSLSDELFYDKAINEFNKNSKAELNLASLKVPLFINLSANALNNNNNINQRLSSDLSFDFDIFNTNLIFKISSLMSQKIDSRTSHESKYFNNFFEDFLNSYTLEFSTGNENAYYRAEELNGNLTIKLPINDLAPALTFSLKGDYYNKNEHLYSDTINFSLNIPFTVSSNKFNFNISKNAGGISGTSGYDYFSDFNQLFSGLNQYTWYYSSLPFIDLFSDSFYTDLYDPSSIEKFYSTKYEFNWKRNLSNFITDLFVPISSSIVISRDITRTDNIADIYQIKLTAGNAFINLLGNEGKLKLLKAFSQDEFNSYLTTIIKIPATSPKDTTFQVSWYGSLLLFIDSQNSVKTGTDISIETNGDYQIRATGIWTHKGNDSILLQIPSLFINDYDKKQSKITRKENFNLSISKNNLIHSELFQFIHNCDLQIKNNYTITTGIGASLKITENAATNLETEFTIGGKILF